MDTPKTYIATIADGASLSDIVPLGIGALARIVMPDAWTAGNLTFQTSYDGTTFNNLYAADGTEYTVTAAASREIIVNLADFLGVRFVKIRSGTSGTAVNQGAARTIRVVSLS